MASPVMAEKAGEFFAGRRFSPCILPWKFVERECWREHLEGDPTAGLEALMLRFPRPTQPWT